MKQIVNINEIVLGGNLKALEYAFKEGLPIFYDKLEVPFVFEKTKEGIDKKDIIQNYAFLLSLAGLNFHSPFVNSFSLQEKKIVIQGGNRSILEINANKVFDFRIDETDEEYIFKVIDYINVRSCGSHDLREIKTEDNFVKEIYFYPSKRANSSKNFSLYTHTYEKVVKDAMVVSYLTRKQIESEDYSPIYSRLRLKEIMKEAGIQGKKRGTRANGNIIRSSILLEFDKRQIIEKEKEERNYYSNASKNRYITKLQGYMHGRKKRKTKKI